MNKKYKKAQVKINALLKERNIINDKLEDPLGVIELIVLDKMEDLRDALWSIFTEEYFKRVDFGYIRNWAGIPIFDGYDSMEVATHDHTRGLDLLVVEFTVYEENTDSGLEKRTYYKIPENFFDDDFIDKTTCQFREYCDKCVKLTYSDIEKNIAELKEKLKKLGNKKEA